MGIDRFLRGQLVTVSLCALETVVSFQIMAKFLPDQYKKGKHDCDADSDDRFSFYCFLDYGEDLAFWILFLWWILRFFHAKYYKPIKKIGWRTLWYKAAKIEFDFEQDHLEEPDFEDDQLATPLKSPSFFIPLDKFI